ncbi:MAG: cell division protein ZipA C-terminal FtsZ-binding domain-containing protein [Acidovorax sp.]
MSTLQLSLAIIGGVVLAVVVGYNAWITRRNTPRRAEPPPQDGAAQQAQAPVAAPAAAEPALRQEPSFDTGLAPPAGGPLESAIEPTLTADALPPLPSASSTQAARPGLDPLIDVIATLNIEGVASGDAAIAALPPTRRAGTKPFAVEGLNQDTQQWEPPQPGQRYTQFQAGVQLANRMGALNEIEFSEFVVKTQAFADAINAAPDFPDMLQEVARARELDQFASEHDAQLSFLLRARVAAWSPGYVQQCAQRQGFVLGAVPGRLVLPASAPGLPPLFTLFYDTQAALSEDPDQSAIRDIALSLDIPQVDRAEQPFNRLREVAAALCQVMDAALCDQNGTPLPAMAMEPIVTDLEQLYDKLDSRELSAGSALARRLFS